MEFLDELKRHGTLRSKPQKSYKVSDPRDNFAKVARTQISHIEKRILDRKGRHRGHWFREELDGTYVVELKNGVVPIKLSGDMSEIVCKSTADAITVIAAAANAAAKGEFDPLFALAKPRRRAARSNGDGDVGS